MDDIKKTFQKYDVDGNGYISYSEAHKVLNEELGLSADRTQTLLHVYDRNNDGKLCYEEFIWFYWKVQEKKEDVAKLFNRFDADANKEISYSEAKEVLKGLGFTDTQVRDLFLIHDKNHDGRLQYDEFVQFWGACSGSKFTF